LGGSRLAADMMDDDLDEKRSKTGENVRIASPNRPTIMIEKFISEMIDLLTSENVVVREGAKDTLGGDLSPSLYAILFRHLEIMMSSCFTTNGEVLCDTSNTLFVEQAVLVLKMILDRLTDPNDCLLSTDFSTLILQLANYINRLPHENYTTMRIMIMMCHLTEVLMLKKEQVIVRDDVRVRNKLLEIIVEWTSDFTLVSIYIYILYVLFVVY
jgi:neurofibromin 1